MLTRSAASVSESGHESRTAESAVVIQGIEVLLVQEFVVVARIVIMEVLDLLFGDVDRALTTTRSTAPRNADYAHVVSDVIGLLFRHVLKSLVRPLLLLKFTFLGANARA